ncbi:MAG: peptidoglycan DD-metalloendopeptidase family protein [FCB group bacterium]|jgi:murein DD-endopeptidase MepM/ murein hydrolase activator NlpD|nr:peptidoglycan DD-metalloendopeptidase family protein [FCB group bacterium]
MKRWQIMVLSHDQSSTKSLTLHGSYLWAAVILLAMLSFSTAFFYKRYERIAGRVDRLERENQELELAKRVPSNSTTVTPEERAQVEREIRAVYEKRDAAITAELNDLYDVEARLREKYELPPRIKIVPELQLDIEGGQGGAPSVYEASFVRPASSKRMARPPHLIYGMARPSADLIVQEIRLRTESFEELIDAMDELQARNSIVARMPSGWPSVHPNVRMSSRFGYRRDPFTGAIRHHDAIDFSAPTGSDIRATGSGVVKFAGWDEYYGNIVRIDHGNNVETWYAHMQKLGARVGQQVKRGDKLGTVGSTGRSTGAHIHYEVRVKGRPVDPSSYLGS